MWYLLCKNPEEWVSLTEMNGESPTELINDLQSQGREVEWVNSREAILSSEQMAVLKVKEM